MPRITPFLWFDDQAEEAAKHYVSIFPNSKIGEMSRYNEESAKASGRRAGSVMTVAFQLDGQDFAAINGGPQFPFTEAVSFVIHCESQEELDHYWARLSEGGQPGPCGWLKDKFGLSWQVIPKNLPELLSDPDPAKSQRVMKAILQMGKIDIETLKRAREGK